jgi:ATP-binding cassette subfamily B protein
LVFFTGLNITLRISLILVIFFFHEPLFALLVFVWIIFFLGGNVAYALWKVKYDKIASEADSRVGAVYSDSISNHGAVKTYAREPDEFDMVDSVAHDLYRKRSFTWLLGISGDAVHALLMMSMEFVILILLAQKWKRGEADVGDFIFFQTYILMLFHFLRDFGRQMRHFFTAIADASEMAEIFEIVPEIQNKKDAQSLQVKKGNIKFQNVGFAYSGEDTQFTDFSLHILSGQSVALVGHTGAGKTTITKLLFRFFDVQSGKILIDGQEISEVTQESLRKSISLVPQQPELFHRTIAENIRFGKPNATLEEVREAARKAHATEFIESLADGFETLVGERGVKLSGGEKQRVAIARAFLEDAPILVLDEATSALDSITEKKIQSAIFELIKNRTSIVIAHRLSTILQMDRIIVLENGKIIEDGNHEELLQRDGVYANMWNHQAGGFISE